MFVYAAEPEVAPADEPQTVAEGLLYIQARALAGAAASDLQ